MITANSKVTALDILNELGVANAENVFGSARVRIGGIAGINTPGHLINIPAECTKVDVIVGDQYFELELAKGNKDDNAEVRTFSENARAALEAEGKVATEGAHKRQAAKELARKLMENEGYTPDKNEEKHLVEAQEIVEAHADAEAKAKEAKKQREVTKVKSK